MVRRHSLIPPRPAFLTAFTEPSGPKAGGRTGTELTYVGFRSLRAQINRETGSRTEGISEHLSGNTAAQVHFAKLIRLLPDFQGLGSSTVNPFRPEYQCRRVALFGYAGNSAASHPKNQLGFALCELPPREINGNTGALLIF